MLTIEKCGTAALGCVEGTKGQSRFVSGHDFNRAENVENKPGFSPGCRFSFAKKHFSTPRLTVTDLRAVLPFCLALLLVTFASAQSPKGKENAQTSDDNTFKVNVRLVDVFASVTDV